MPLNFLRDNARRKLRLAPFPDAWMEYLNENVSHYRYLSDWEQEVLRGDLRIFMQEKHWEGCGGLTLTDEMKVTISAQACLLCLNLDDKYFPNVLSIFVYPAGYRAKERTIGPGGVVTEGESHRLGEAWQTGPVVLSWSDSLAGGRNDADGRNVVIHEFAHKLDMADGLADGTPRLANDEEYRRWYEAMKSEWDVLVGVSPDGRATILDEYGATNAAELFAVAAEAFFEKPRQMRSRHPVLYDVLHDYFRQDPAERLDGAEILDEEAARHEGETE